MISTRHNGSLGTMSQNIVSRYQTLSPQNTKGIKHCLAFFFFFNVGLETYNPEIKT